MDKIRIGVWGASTTYGSGDKEAGGWVNRLRLYFDNKFKEYERIDVHNCGIGGGTYAHLIDRFSVEAKHRRPNVVVFGGGGNDYVTLEKGGKPVVGVDEFRENLKKLVEMAREWTDKIVFVGQAHMDESKTCPVSWNDIYYKNEYVDLYNSVIKEFCETEGLVYVSLDEVLDIERDYEDGAHPNSGGHEKMFKRILPFVEKIINARAGT